MRVVLFDDARAASWMPFALTRPAAELLFGAHTFHARAERLFGPVVEIIAHPALRGFDEPGTAPVVSHDEASLPSPTLFLSSRAVVDWGARFDFDRPGLLRVQGETAGCFLPVGSPPPADFFAKPHAFELHLSAEGRAEFRPVTERGASSAHTSGLATPYAASGRILEHVWDLIALNAQQITKDFDGSRTGEAVQPARTVRKGVRTIGGSSDRVRVGKGVTIEPGVVVDVSSGPVWFEDHATVRAFSRIQGPAFIGRDSTLLGGSFSALSIGPVCKVHGEVEETVVLGYSNKAHDGFLGHAYLGRWVNLGALTTNSDLKNNYGTIRMWTPEGEVDTGLVKMGCLLGDHVKTGIGVMINTGTIVGAGCNLFGAVQPPKHVPAFKWGSGGELVDHDIEKFLDTAKTVMGRRGITLSDAHAGLLRRAWSRSGSGGGGGRG